MGLKDFLFEEEDKPKVKASPSVTPEPLPAVSYSSEHSEVVLPASGSSVEAALQKLRDKTNFDSTEIGQQLKKFLSPLESIGLDEKTKYKAALATANAQMGLTADKVLGVFDALTLSLAAEQRNFQAATSQYEAKEIKDRQSHLQAISDSIAQKKKELEDLTNQLAVVSGDLTAAQQKEQQIAADFSQAVSLRAGELSQQHSKFLSLLKG